MSDWEDFCESMGADPSSSDDYDRMVNLLPGLPNLKPSKSSQITNDEGKDEPTELHFETFQEAAEWSKKNQGRGFTRSADGKHFVPLERAGKMDKKISSSEYAVLRFETFKQVWAWAEANPGGTYVRAPDGRGFEAKPYQRVSAAHRDFTPKPKYGAWHSDASDQRKYEADVRREAEIEALAPHFHDVTTNCYSSAKNSVLMRPVNYDIWDYELKQLSNIQLKRLRLLIATKLKEDREDLSDLEKQIRRDRRMKPGHYGEDLSKRIISALEQAIKDIDKRLS